VELVINIHAYVANCLESNHYSTEFQSPRGLPGMPRLLNMVLLIPAALGGTLQVIDHQGQCFVYSTHNFGCTGISEPFAPLDGISCSSKQAPWELGMLLIASRSEYEEG